MLFFFRRFVYRSLPSFFCFDNYIYRLTLMSISFNINMSTCSNGFPPKWREMVFRHDFQTVWSFQRKRHNSLISTLLYFKPLFRSHSFSWLQIRSRNNLNVFFLYARFYVLDNTLAEEKNNSCFLKDKYTRVHANE